MNLMVPILPFFNAGLHTRFLFVLSHLWVTTGTYTCTPIISKFLSN